MPCLRKPRVSVLSLGLLLLYLCFSLSALDSSVWFLVTQKVFVLDFCSLSGLGLLLYWLQYANPLTWDVNQVVFLDCSPVSTWYNLDSSLSLRFCHPFMTYRSYFLYHAMINWFSGTDFYKIKLKNYFLPLKAIMSKEVNMDPSA